MYIHTVTSGLSVTGLSVTGLSDTGLSGNLIYLTRCCESLNCTQFYLIYPTPGLPDTFAGTCHRINQIPLCVRYVHTYVCTYVVPIGMYCRQNSCMSCMYVSQTGNFHVEKNCEFALVKIFSLIRRSMRIYQQQNFCTYPIPVHYVLYIHTYISLLLGTIGMHTVHTYVQSNLTIMNPGYNELPDITNINLRMYCYLLQCK